MDTKLAYLISLGIIGFGVIWIVVGAKAGSATLFVGIALGVLTIIVGLISLLIEVRNRTY
jgi:hypothetical protein